MMGHLLISGHGSGEFSEDCCIYVDSDNMAAVGRVVGGEMSATGTLVTAGLRGFMAHNDYEVGSAYGSDFLSWPSVLECEPISEAEDFRDAVRRVLEALWGAGMRAVAVCDFEDGLPCSGGVDLYR
jgi:hypothetical protein